MNDNSYKNWSSMHDKAIAAQIGAYIKHCRIDQNKTQESLSKAAGISRSTLSLLEKGEPVTITTLIQVLRVLDQLHVMNAFVVEEVISPLLLAEMQRDKRKRASKNKSD
jgi:transcriptional regulator with XRE-family HTH domain